jgi:hypothetical protein
MNGVLVLLEWSVANLPTVSFVCLVERGAWIGSCVCERESLAHDILISCRKEVLLDWIASSN